MNKKILAVNAESANTAKKSVGENRKGQILSFAGAVIGVAGFVVFVSSVEEVNKISTNYVGVVVGIILLLTAFFLGSRKESKEYMKKYSNEA